MRHKRQKASSTKHPKSKSLQAIHGVQSNSMLLTAPPRGSVLVNAGDQDHPSNALGCDPNAAGSTGSTGTPSAS